jgi:hypothetical protein
MKRQANVYLCGQARIEKSSQVLRRDGIALHGKWNHNFTILVYNVTWALENYSGGVHSAQQCAHAHPFQVVYESVPHIVFSS